MSNMQPHIRCTEEDAALYAILPGDPMRTERVKALLTDAKDIAYNTLMATVSATITGAGITEAIVSAVVCGAVCTALIKYSERKR